MTNTLVNLTALKQSEKDLLEKIKNNEIGNISTNESIEKLKKEIKIL